MKEKKFFYIPNQSRRWPFKSIKAIMYWVEWYMGKCINERKATRGKKEELRILRYEDLHCLWSRIMLFEGGLIVVRNVYCKVKGN